MTVYRRGDVILVAFPFTDLTTAKMRPALVVSSGRIPDPTLAVLTIELHKLLQ
jgi:hypothetical protein